MSRVMTILLHFDLNSTPVNLLYLKYRIAPEQPMSQTAPPRPASARGRGERFKPLLGSRARVTGVRF